MGNLLLIIRIHLKKYIYHSSLNDEPKPEVFDNSKFNVKIVIMSDLYELVTVHHSLDKLSFGQI